MELCEGGDLSTLLREHGPLTPKETRVILQQLARAISYLHKNGIHDHRHVLLSS